VLAGIKGVVITAVADKGVDFLQNALFVRTGRAWAYRVQREKKKEKPGHCHMKQRPVSGLNHIYQLTGV
jgi:hypothetical protein